MKKKAALAAALIHNPRVLFLDEPLNGIDPISGRVVTDLLRRMAQKGVTLFFTTHALDVAERLCDEVAVIDHGRIVAQGSLDEIRAQRQVEGGASLEDVFLKLVAADVRRDDLSWLG
jgi:ABC-2 type transport system ATP-binding protein